MAQAAANRLSQLREKDTYGTALLSDFDSRYQRQLNRLLPNLETNAYSALDPSDQQRRALVMELIELERGILHELRSRGDLYDEVYHHLGDELDLEALRVRRNLRPI